MTYSAAKARQLRQIAFEIEKCAFCVSHSTGRLVPGEGLSDAQIVFIGEAPGKEEIKTGRPFVGRSGKVLRSLIVGVGLKESEVFITSPVKYLPSPVTPNRREIEHGREHLQKQLAVIKPKICVLLGNTAVLAVLGEKHSIAKEHGRIIDREEGKFFLTFHPAAQLYAPALKPLALADFKKLKKLISATL